ncbi:MAG: hypothetical protein OEV42_04880 [Deltaproteobacteria bacterium]|nr:hypothetical protein [Deltaproteobacteria bacterium]
MAVGFFTHGIEYTLPHPPIPKRTILLLCNVIKRAWQLLQEKPPSGFIIHSAHEDTITQVLVEIIENHLRKNGDIPGFNYALFGKVIREPKITNFDKKHPDKMPDIFFDLKREKQPVLNDQDGLFVECKPVGKTHPILSCYCNKGLVRFVNGDYAWAMQDALIVGYNKDSYSFTKLASVLGDNSKNVDLNVTAHSIVSKSEFYTSTHNRDFEWLERNGTACPIEVSHLWLKV